MAEAIDEAFEAAEGRNVVVFGASIAQQCIREGRLTDLVMHMVPVLLGNGIRLVEEESIDATRLRLVSSENHGQIIDVHLRIRNGI
jgi:dihydrofolate reductase